jgi:hypothetical protein
MLPWVRRCMKFKKRSTASAGVSPLCEDPQQVGNVGHAIATDIDGTIDPKGRHDLQQVFHVDDVRRSPTRYQISRRARVRRFTCRFNWFRLAAPSCRPMQQHQHKHTTRTSVYSLVVDDFGDSICMCGVRQYCGTYRPRESPWCSSSRFRHRAGNQRHT